MSGNGKPSSDHGAMGFDSVKLITWPKLIFTWPIVVMGILFGLLQILGWVTEDAFWILPTSSAAQYWWWFIGLTVVLLTICVDLNRNHAIFWAIFICLIFALNSLFPIGEGEQVQTAWQKLISTLSKKPVEYPVVAGWFMAIILGFAYIFMAIKVLSSDRWTFTRNRFEREAVGMSEDSFARGAKRVVVSYPDVLELLLGLCGTIKILHPSQNKVLKELPHVFFAPMKGSKIRKLLATTAVTPEEADEMAESESEGDADL